MKISSRYTPNTYILFLSAGRPHPSQAEIDNNRIIVDTRWSFAGSGPALTAVLGAVFSVYFIRNQFTIS